MNRKILIATHSTFAEGIKNALELILGQQTSLFSLCAYTDQISEVATPAKEFIDQLSEDEELIVATDIFGGSVNNEFMNYLSDPRIYLITGVNLPLLFELVMNINAEDTKGLIEPAIEKAKEQLQYCNAILRENVAEDNF